MVTKSLESFASMLLPDLLLVDNHIFGKYDIAADGYKRKENAMIIELFSFMLN